MLQCYARYQLSGLLAFLSLRPSFFSSEFSKKLHSVFSKMRSSLSMRALCALVTLLSINSSFSAASPSYKEPAPLKYEHPGDLFQKVSGGSCCVDGVLTGANSTGETKSIAGSKSNCHDSPMPCKTVLIQQSVSTYIATPASKKTDVAILYLTDIFGTVLVNNRLYASLIHRLRNSLTVA